jgi:hypothetical protein
VLYVIQANLDLGKITKFGIAGMDSGNPFSRLNEYVLMYGPLDPKNECQGVKVFFIGVTRYNRLVEARNSQVHKIEKKLKDEVKSVREHIGRGLERTTRKPAAIIKRIKQLTKETGLEDEESNLQNRELVSGNTRASTQVYRDDRRSTIDMPIEGARKSTRNQTAKEKNVENEIVKASRRSRRLLEQSKGPS